MGKLSIRPLRDEFRYGHGLRPLEHGQRLILDEDIKQGVPEKLRALLCVIVIPFSIADDTHRLYYGLLHTREGVCTLSQGALCFLEFGDIGKHISGVKHRFGQRELF